MAQLNYLINTTTLATTASGTTVASGNTQAGSYALARTLVRSGVGAAELLGTSQTWSLRTVVSATTGLYAMRFKLQRRNSSGVVQSESSYVAHNPVTVTTYDDDFTWASGGWAAGDQLAVVWEHFRTSGSGNKSATVDANGASFVTAPTAAGVPHAVSPSDGVGAAEVLSPSRGLSLVIEDAAGSGDAFGREAEMYRALADLVSAADVADPQAGSEVPTFVRQIVVLL